MSSRPTSPSPVGPERLFSPPPRIRSPPPLAPSSRAFSPTRNVSPPPLPRVTSPPPILNILPSTPVRPSSPDQIPLPDPPKLPGSKSLDAISEVVETGDGSESETGQKISSNSSSLILPASPQRKATTGTAVGTLTPLEGNRSMTVEVSKPASTSQLATTEKEKTSAKTAEAALKSVKSSDTIKGPVQPKPPKKKRSRAANIANNTTSTKAEIFAAKVAAVVDARPDSSDSEETFVYDSSAPNASTSNAREQPSKPRSGLHSRTPSMTSLNSAYTSGNAAYGTVPAGRGGGRTSNEEGYNFPTMTRAQSRSLQKTNSNSDDGKRRTILPDDSPFTLHVKSASRNTISPQPSKTSIRPPGSPRPKTTLPRTIKTPKWAQSQFYDGDDDDSYIPTQDSSNERVPLLPRDPNRSTRRPTKGYKSRNRVPSQKQQTQIHANYERRRSSRFSRAPVESRCWPGLAGTAILVLTLLILTMLTVGFVFQTSRSLEGFEVRNVTNIVVSQEELVMDVLIDASNPNILPVTVGDILNIDIFARSEHFEPPTTPLKRGITRGLPFWPPSTKPPADKPHNVTEGTSLLLGTIHALEAPISFPPTSFKRESFTTQKGQMKLVGPAVNATDGPEKWKRAILFNFELIVRGTVRYRAPIGGRERAVAVEWRGTVDPLGNRVWNGDEWEDSE